MKHDTNKEWLINVYYLLNPYDPMFTTYNIQAEPKKIDYLDEEYFTLIIKLTYIYARISKFIANCVRNIAKSKAKKIAIFGPSGEEKV